MNSKLITKTNTAARLLMAALLAGGYALPARAQADVKVGVRYEDLDTKGHPNQVMEYDGKTYGGKNAVRFDGEVHNQGTEGLYDLILKDFGSGEEKAAFNLDHKNGLRLNAMYQNMHHRIGYMRVGEIHDGSWLPKTAITLLDAQDANLLIRRTETELGVAYVDPVNAARFLSLQYWAVEKFGSMSWSETGNPNIERTKVDVDNFKQDLSLAAGTNIKEDGAVSLEVVHSEFKDNVPVLASPVDGAAAGSSHNGGLIKDQYPRVNMDAAEFRFREDLSKNFSVNGVFSGRERENLRTQYKQDTAVVALNAAYKVNKKLSFIGKLYFSGSQIDENTGFLAPILRAGGVVAVNTHQIDKNQLRAEFIANLKPCDKATVKASYKVEVANRRDAPTQAYAANRYYADGYFLGILNNEVARNDTKHTFNLKATAELPLGLSAEAGYKNMRANVPAFINMPNRSDEVNGTLSASLPKDVSVYVMGIYLKEKNTRDDFEHYSQTRDTYRAGLDWAATNAVYLGADASFETVRSFQEWYFGNGSATPSATTSFHTSALTQTRNTVWGAHAKANLPKGFVVTGNGSYTRTTIQTPVVLAYTGGTLNDYTPNNTNIARGSVALEYTPEFYKSLTARASYSVSQWVDKFDELNSGRYSVAQLGASMKF